MRKSILLTVSFFILVLIALILPLVMFSERGISFTIVLSGYLIVFALVCLITIQQGLLQVPHMMEYIIEIFGKYTEEPLGPGLHYVFPWFGFCRVRSRVPMDERIMSLYSDERKDIPKTDIEFRDCSSSVTAFFYFKVVDSAKATYQAANVMKSIKEKADATLRAFLGDYTIDQAIEMKNKFSLKTISCCIEPDQYKKGYIVSNKEFYRSEFYKSLYRWGIEPLSFTIADIILPQSVIDQRARTLTAEQDIMVAKKKMKQTVVEKNIQIIVAEGNKQSRILISEGEKAARILEGEGEKEFQVSLGAGQAEKIKLITANGFPAEGIMSLLIAEKKWEAVAKSETDKTIILDSPGSSVVAGSEFGAGFKTAIENKQ